METMELVINGISLQEMSRSHYVDLPFHNLEHATEVAMKSLELADYCEKEGHQVDRFVLLAAAFFHDAGYFLDLDDTRFSSKEEYSAHIATQELLQQDIPINTIEHIAACIKSTERGVHCDSLEAKIIRQADLDNLSGPFKLMVKKSWLLLREEQQLKGKIIGPIAFMGGIASNIQPYLEEDVSLGPFDRDRGKSLWLKCVERNMKLLSMVINEPKDNALRLLERFR